MHICIVHNLAIPVYGYGGVERIIWWLGKELVKRGHRVTYVVPAGSSCPFADIVIEDTSLTLNDQIPDDVDVIHMCYQSKEKLKKPYLMMYQYNYHPEAEFDINTVFVSKNHAKRNESNCYVYNCLDPDDYGPVDLKSPRKHLLFLGYAKRPEKNVKGCLEIARKTKNVLAVVGGKDKWYRRRPWVSYKGFIGGEEKNKILQQSNALLFPIQWHEPFGIALIEALYFGAPVIGSPYGSLPELIHEEVGFLSTSLSEMVTAVKNLEQFDPQTCHEYIRDNFLATHMTDEYMKLYEKVLSGNTLNEKNPVNGGNFSRDELLEIRP